MTCPNCESHAMDLLTAISTIRAVWTSLGFPAGGALHQLPEVAAMFKERFDRIRQERDDLRATMDEIRLLLDMPGATTADVLRELEVRCA